jgi:hypothetical protein
MSTIGDITNEVRSSLVAGGRFLDMSQEEHASNGKAVCRGVV